MTLLYHSELNYNIPEKSELVFGKDGHVQAGIEGGNSVKGRVTARSGPGFSCTLRSPFTPASTLMLRFVALPASENSSNGQVVEVGTWAFLCYFGWDGAFSPPSCLKKRFWRNPIISLGLEVSVPSGSGYPGVSRSVLSAAMPPRSAVPQPLGDPLRAVLSLLTVRL